MILLDPLLAARAHAAAPLRIVDDVGTTVTVAAAPKRIVCLSPGATEILFAIGAGSRIVATCGSCDHPAAARSCARVGEFANPSLEAILAQKPDLVVATGGAQRDTVLRLRQGRTPVVVCYPNGVSGVLRNIRDLGRIAGRPSAAAKLERDLKARLDAVAAKTRAIPDADRPEVYFEIWADPIMAIGDASYPGELVRLAGGINLTRNTPGDYPKLSAEAVIAADPDVIMLSRCEDPWEPAALIAKRPGWANLKAVTSKRVFADLDTDTIFRPGPRLAEGVEALYGRLHGKNMKKKEQRQ